jgi:hypothetical protein
LRLGTANSGVPMKMIRIFSSKPLASRIATPYQHKHGID